MPEGDTVFLAGRRLHDALAGNRLVRAELRHPRLSTVDLAGLAVLGVHTVGKHLLTRFDDGRSLHSHLRMDGSWHLYRPGRPWHGGPLHAVRAVLATADRVAVGYRLHDLELLPTAEEHRLIGHLGPDLLAADWDVDTEAEAARRLAAGPHTPIGLALLDQTVMAGVGNLYRAEICFLLGVSPWTPVAEVDAAETVRLARRLLLLNAWRPHQSTTGDLRRGAGTWVYTRTGRACRRCGSPVRSATMADPELTGKEVAAAAALSAERMIYFCPTCQRGPLPRRRGTAEGGEPTRSPRTPPRRRTARSTG